MGGLRGGEILFCKEKDLYEDASIVIFISQTNDIDVFEVLSWGLGKCLVLAFVHACFGSTGKGE